MRKRRRARGKGKIPAARPDRWLLVSMGWPPDTLTGHLTSELFESFQFIADSFIQTYRECRNRVGAALPATLDREHMMEAAMLSPDRVPDLSPLADAAADYDIVRRAIAHIRENWREQPDIETIAESVGVTPTELHHLFRRWAGLTPKAFLQALTLDHARTLLRSSASVLDASFEVGLSGPGRLHDLFVTHEAMSPG